MRPAKAVCEFIDCSDPRWKDALARGAHDVYQTPEYTALCARHSGAEAVAFLATDGDNVTLIPLLKRQVPMEQGAEAWHDFTSGYGYPSILSYGDTDWLRESLRMFVHTCRQSDIVNVFIRLHPLADLQTTELEQYGSVLLHGRTVHVDLTASDREIWSGTRRRYRSYINSLVRHGFRVEIDDWTFYDEFVALYQQTMRRLHADCAYLLSDSYFEDLKWTLGNSLHLITVFSPDNELASAAAFSSLNGIVQYLFSGTADKFYACGPSKLLLHEARLWAKRQGNRVLHLGGGVGGTEDTLFSFKSGFSPSRSCFATLRIVVDEEKYRRLTWAQFGLGDGQAANGFFPEYRMP